MLQTTKLTPQETQQLSQIQEKQQSYIIDLGKIEYDITLLELQKEKIQDQIEKGVMSKRVIDIIRDKESFKQFFGE